MVRRPSLAIRVLAVVGTAALIAYAAFAVLSVKAAVDRHCERKLTRTAWKHREGYGVAKRAVRCHQLVGRSSDEVRALMGPPAEHYQGSWKYRAGSGGLLSSEWNLVLDFDAQHRVQNAEMIPQPLGS